MKTILPLLLLACALFGAVRLPAEPATTIAPSATETREMVALEKFLALDDAQLDEMQRAIARVRAMSPAERAKLRGQIAQFRQLPAAERQAWRQGWGQLPAELRDGWREMMQSATEAERAEIHRQLEAAAPGERIAVRRQLVDEFLRRRGK